MQGKTRSQKPSLILRLDKVTPSKRLSRIIEVVEEVDIRIESCLNVEPSVCCASFQMDAQNTMDTRGTRSG